ncbi:MAG: arsenite methyltransferase [Syntrophomonadaceae bacterium]|jgi:arsenite methyltransferase
MNNKEEIREFIRKNYSEVAFQGSTEGCCSSGCCCGGQQINIKDASINIGYSKSDFEDIPIESNMGLGCGNPIAIAGLKEGETVLDLGSGGGFDCFLARKQVGDSGYVIGIDMTPEMVKLARQNADKSGYKNIEFRLGEIEHLPVGDGSVDVIISNCVINLALEKQQVFNEAFRVLKAGGRLSISDIVATASIPDDMKNDLASLAGCIAGAEYVGNIENMLQNAGFENICMIPKDNSKEIIKSWVPEKNAEDFVASYIIKADKPRK